MTCTPLPPDLDPRFITIKQSLVSPDKVEAVTASWKRLLKALEEEMKNIEKEGPTYVPEVCWQDIIDNNYQLPADIADKFRNRGTLMVTGVIEETQVNKWFDELVEFCKEHPETAGYTFPNPTSWYNVFWTKPQTECRSHPNVQKLFNMLSNQFYVKDNATLIDFDSQVVYGDRIRIRPPGTTAKLPLHLDLSSIERWEDPIFRSVYQEIFDGNWEHWDPFLMDKRAVAKENLYHDFGLPRDTICSAFRTLQGWMALSDNRLGEGTLKVVPNLKLVTAYIMLRPLFWKDPESGNIEDYEIDLETPKFPGATPSTGQLYVHDHFPHITLSVSIPDVKKGTFAFWHADIAHEVDKQHLGKNDSSVLYYGITPLTVGNIDTLLDTRNSFKANISPEDYRSQLSEEDKAKEFQGADVKHIKNDKFKQLMGLMPFDIEEGLSTGKRQLREMANKALATG